MSVYNWLYIHYELQCPQYGLCLQTSSSARILQGFQTKSGKMSAVLRCIIIRITPQFQFISDTEYWFPNSTSFDLVREFDLRTLPGSNIEPSSRYDPDSRILPVPTRQKGSMVQACSEQLGPSNVKGTYTLNFQYL